MSLGRFSGDHADNVMRVNKTWRGDCEGELVIIPVMIISAELMLTGAASL